MTTTHINRLRCVVTNTPGTSGNVVVGAATSAARRTFTAAENGKTFQPTFEDGNAWEERSGCVYTHSTQTLTRGTLVDSSTGSAIALSSASVVSLGATAKQMQDLELAAFGVAVSDAANVTLVAADAGSSRVPSGAMTYTINTSTAWTAGQSVVVYLPTSGGSISFAVSGGATINGGTATLTRDLASNSTGYVVLTRIQGTNSYSLGGSSGSNLSFDGTKWTISLGTITTQTGPLRLTETRNNAAIVFPGIVYNVTDTSSNSLSAMLDLQIGGSSIFKVGSNGRLDTTYVVATGFLFAPTVRLNSDSAELSLGASHDVIMKRDAANVWARRNGTVAQEDRTYGTFSDASNYRRVSSGMSAAGGGYIRPEGAGTGAAGNVLLVTTGAVAVASLPAASTVPYTHAAVTDASATTRLSTVAGGGSNKVPVWSDGTNWVIL